MKDLKNEYQSFIQDSSPERTSAPAHVLSKIHRQIEEERPTLKTVALKIGFVHVGASLVTLMACSQFGVQLIFKGGGLMNFFMKISPLLCEAFCGALYFAITFFMARLYLKHEEWLTVQRSRSLMIASLALISLGAFSLVSHEMTFETGLLWLFGAAVGGELMSIARLPFLRLIKK